MMLMKLKINVETNILEIQVVGQALDLGVIASELWQVTPGQVAATRTLMVSETGSYAFLTALLRFFASTLRQLLPAPSSSFLCAKMTRPSPLFMRAINRVARLNDDMGASDVFVERVLSRRNTC
jgi:hypothetical protein